MNLADVYTNHIVSRKIRIPSGITSSSVSVAPERDPKLIQLENTVTNQMQQAIKQYAEPQKVNTSPRVVTKSIVREVSFQEAIQELLELEKQQNS